MVAGGLGPPRLVAGARPSSARAAAEVGDPAADAVAAALAGIRGAKSQAKVSMRAELSPASRSADRRELVEAASQAADDLRKAGKITGDLVFTARRDAAAEICLSPPSSTRAAD